MPPAASGRFSPNNFQYNGRVALAFVPSLVVLAGVAGAFVVAALMVGAIVAYVMDALRWREAALGSIWFTLVIGNLGFLLEHGLQRDRSMLMSVGTIGIVGGTLMITGVWASIQFKWIQLKHPAVVIALERLLLVACLPVGLVVQTWGIAATVGFGNAPFYMMGLGCLLYFLCMVPLPSSFQSRIALGIGGNSQATGQIQGRGDGLVAALTISILPGLTYFASHYGMILHPEHFWSLALLWSTPLLFICGLPGGLWWVSENPQAQRAFRVIFITLSGVVAIAGFEFRVIFHSFSQYIPLAPPWSWITVTVCLYTHAAIVGAHFTGILDSQTGFIFGGGALIVCAGVGGALFGFPMPLMPCPLIGAAGLALYYDSRQLRDYLVFMGGTAISFIYLLYKHFWFLEVTVNGLSVRFICQLIAAGIVVALVVPGLILSGISDAITRNGLEVFLLIQGAVMCVLEERLHSVESDAQDVIYPAYLVLATSIAGIGMTKRLEGMQTITDVTSYLLQCMYIAKLPLLLLPQANLLIPSFGVALAVLPPYLLSSLESQEQNERLHPWQAGVLVTAVIFSIGLARFAIFDLIQAYFAEHPSEALLLGVLLLAVSAGCFPLVSRYYPNSQAGRRWLIVASGIGILLCVLRPPFPIQGGAKCPDLPFGICPRLWDERHIPGRDMDDVEMYGLGLARIEHWPLWMIFFAIVMGLFAVTSGVPVHKSTRTRVCYAALGGFSSGAYLALEFFPEQGPLQLIVLMSMVLVCGFLVLLQRPPAVVWGRYMSTLAFAWGSLLPIAMVLQGALPLPEIPEDMRRLFPDGNLMLENERRSAGRASLMAIYAAQAFLMSFAIHLKVSSALKSVGTVLPQSGGRSSGKTPWRAMCSPGGFAVMFGSMVPPKVLDRMSRLTKMDGAGAMMLQRLSAEGMGWAPTAGNLMAILSFSTCLILNLYFTRGKPEGALLVAPILLLLNQDPFLLRGLTPRQRYFPPVVVLSVYLLGSYFLRVFDMGLVHPDNYLDPGDSSFVFVVKNVALGCATVPSQVQTLRFLWGNRQDPVSNLLFMTPLNVLPIFFSAYKTLKYLCCIGVIGAVIEYCSKRHIRKMGMRTI